MCSIAQFALFDTYNFVKLCILFFSALLNFENLIRNKVVTINPKLFGGLPGKKTCILAEIA